jgi:hypothetical protein
MAAFCKRFLTLFLTPPLVLGARYGVDIGIGAGVLLTMYRMVTAESGAFSAAIDAVPLPFCLLLLMVNGVVSSYLGAALGLAVGWLLSLGTQAQKP